MTRLVIFIVFFTYFTVALPMDRDGLRGGMSIDEVSGILVQNGFRVLKMVMPPRVDPVVFFSRQNTSLPTGSVTFCEGKLSAYTPIQSVQESTAKEFFARLEESTSILGPGNYITVRSTGQNRPFILRFQWRLKHEVVNLDYVSFFPGVGENISLTYVEPNSCDDNNRAPVP